MTKFYIVPLAFHSQWPARGCKARIHSSVQWVLVREPTIRKDIAEDTQSNNT